MYAKNLQISMNSAVVAQLPPSKRRNTQLADRKHTAKQKKSLYSGTTAHMKNIT